MVISGSGWPLYFYLTSVLTTFFRIQELPVFTGSEDPPRPGCQVRSPSVPWVRLGPTTLLPAPFRFPFQRIVYVLKSLLKFFELNDLRVYTLVTQPDKGKGQVVFPWGNPYDRWGRL